MNKQTILDSLELPQEPKGEVTATITRVTTENKNGEPIVSKFDKKTRLLIVAETNGFEVAEFCTLPAGKYITGKLKRIMEAVGAKKISELAGKKVTVRKILTQNGNQKWTIIGNGASAPSFSKLYKSGTQLLLMNSFTAVIHHEEDTYVAQCPEVGTVSQGKTIEEAIANLKEATALYLEEFQPPKNGKPIMAVFELS